MEKVEKLSSCGRYLNREMKKGEIPYYLGMGKNKSQDFKKAVYQEFREFEKEFKNQNVDFALNSDLGFDNNGISTLYNIVKNGKLISAFII